MKFSCSFAVILLIAFGINGQTNDINTLNAEEIEKGYPFGKLRLSEDGKKEELIPPNQNEKLQLDQDQSSGVQPLPSPCTGVRSATKLSYPKDKTKYIQCRDEFHYEIFTCPNGGEYNEQMNTCELTVHLIDKCEQEKPCLNDGLCSVLSNSTFKCTCRPDWTGDRCETPINSCVTKPCGPNAECRILKTNDYEQDYVCVCPSKRGYGLNCQEVVPNPCLTINEQFFPFAFSQHAYIQCDGDIVYFQPCGPLLYWNQEEKVCDRKRPAKIDLPALLTKLSAGNTENQQENKEEMDSTTTTTTTTTTEQSVQQGQDSRGNEPTLAFVPARVANRQQGFLGQNLNQNQQQTQESQNRFTQSTGSNQNRQDTDSTSGQWSNQPTVVQSGQNQQWSQTTQKPSRVQSQNFPQQNQQFGTQQWLNQVPTTNTQNTQRFAPQSQSWQTSQNQQTSFETTAKPQNLNVQSWQMKPTTQWNTNQVPQTQSWQTSPTLPNQQQFQDDNQETSFETTTKPQNLNVQSWQMKPSTQWNTNQVPQTQSWQTSQNQQTSFETTTKPQQVVLKNSNVQSWQTKPATQWNTNQVPQTQSWQTSQTLPNQQQQQFQDDNQESTIETTTKSNVQSWQNKPTTQWNTNQVPQIQSWQNQGQQTTFETTTKPQHVAGLTGIRNSNVQSWQNKPTTQWNTNQVPQTQSWQTSQTLPNQQQFQDDDEQSTFETTTKSQQVVGLTGLKNSNVQSWQNKPTTQWNTNQVQQTVGFNPQNTETVVLQPQLSQTSQTAQDQTPLEPQNQMSNIETTTLGQNVNRFVSGSQKLNAPVQQQSWQNRPTTQSWQNQNQQLSFETTTKASNTQSWQNKPSTQWNTQVPKTIGFHLQSNQNTVPQTQTWQNTDRQRQTFAQPQTSLIDIQRLPVNDEQTLTGESTETQQWPSMENSQSSTNLNNGQPQTNTKSQVKQNNQQFGTQQWLNQVPTTNTQSLVPQSQSWQTSQNQQTSFETTTKPQQVVLKNSNIQSWQSKPTTQWNTNQVPQTQPWQTSQTLPNQQQQFQDDNQESTVETTTKSNVQSWQNKPTNQGSRTIGFSPQNTQSGLIQQKGVSPIQSSFDETPSWSNNQQWPSNSQSSETAKLATKGSQPITDQRKTLDAVPTSFTGSWSSRT